MAKKSGPRETLTPPIGAVTDGPWREYFESRGGPSDEEKRATKAREALAAGERERHRRANAFPLLAGQTVRCMIHGWRFNDARVTRDDGPASNGERLIEIQKLHGPRAGEKITVRRDRVSPMPGAIGQTAGAGR